MPISKIKSGAINDDAITNAKLADDAVNSAEIATNIEFTGTEAVRMPVGTTAQRANAQSGDIRFNSTLSLMEYYDGTQWKSIDSPPIISSVSPDNFDTAGDTITITGSNLQSGLTVKLVAADGSEFSASTVTFTNSTTASFDITQAMVDDDNDPYDVKVTNTSSLSGTLADALDFAPEPSFTVAAGTLATIYDSARSSLSFTTGATSAESDATITYAVTTGSLPSGLSISSSTGTITGSTSAVGSDTTTTFTITATATDGDSNVTTNTRQYSIIQKAPVITSYTSSSGSFSVPSGLTAVDVLVVGGGGGGGCVYHAGGGGAGGLIYRPAFPVTPGGSISYSVGDGGAGGANPNGLSPAGATGGSQLNGQNSTFGTLTALGGGGGTSYSHPDRTTAGQGGSGGAIGQAGASAPNNYPSAQYGGSGQQPSQPGDSGTYGFGNPGGGSVNQGPADGWVGGGGGGGAGGAGAQGYNVGPSNDPAYSKGGNGGVGKQYDISGSQVYYAGGGGGAGSGTTQQPGGQGGQGGGGGGAGPAPLGYYADPQGAGTVGGSGTANRGGGGGGGERGSPEVYRTNPQSTNGGYGGSGIVIVKY